MQSGDMARGKENRVTHAEIGSLFSQLFDYRDAALIQDIVALMESRAVPHWQLDPHETVDALRTVMLPLEQKIGGKGTDERCGRAYILKPRATLSHAG